MKKILSIVLVFSLAATAVADGKYLLFWCNNTITAPDKTKIKNKIQTRFSDATQISYSDLPEYRVISNPSKIGRVLCIDVTGKGFNVTKAEMETWRDANLSEPAKLQWATGADPQQTLADVGLEAIIEELD